MRGEKMREDLTIPWSCGMFVVLSLGVVYLQIDTAIGLLLSFIGFFGTYIPLVYKAMNRFSICTKESFLASGSSFVREKKIYVGVNSESYCNALNHFLYLCIWISCGLLLTIFFEMPFESAWVIWCVFGIWGISFLLFWFYSVKKINSKWFTKSSGFVIVINVMTLGVTKYLGEFVQSVEDFSLYVLIVLLYIVLSVVPVLFIFLKTTAKLKKLATFPLFTRDVDDSIELKIEVINGIVYDRRKELFYPIIKNDSITIVYRDVEKSDRVISFAEIKNCVIVGDNGVRINIPYGKKDK